MSVLPYASATRAFRVCVSNRVLPEIRMVFTSKGTPGDSLPPPSRSMVSPVLRDEGVGGRTGWTYCSNEPAPGAMGPAAWTASGKSMSRAANRGMGLSGSAWGFTDISLGWR